MSAAAGSPSTGSRWRRPAAALVALATVPDLLLGLAASVETLYYAAVLMLAPLAVFRAVLGLRAAHLAWTAPRRAPRWVWAGQLAHSLLVIWALRGRHADLLRGVGGGRSPAGALEVALAIWPYAMGLLAAWALVREMQDTGAARVLPAGGGGADQRGCG